MLGLVVLLHQPQTIALAHEGNLLVAVDIDGSVEICQCIFVVLHFEEELAPVDVSFVVLGVTSDASVELSRWQITIYSVSSYFYVFL